MKIESLPFDFHAAQGGALPPGRGATRCPMPWQQLANQNVFAGKLAPQEPAAELPARIRASRAAQPQNTRRSSA